MKFNLLFALDERQETEARETAFSEAVVPVAQATHDLERFTAILLECAHNQKLGMTTRRKLLGWVLFTAAEYRRPDLLARVLREEAFATCTTEVRDSAAVVSEALKMSGDKPDAEAFRLLIRSPIDYLRCYLADRLLCELAASGQAALAGDLLASAGTLTLTSTFDQTPAGVRLQWLQPQSLGAAMLAVEVCAVTAVAFALTHRQPVGCTVTGAGAGFDVAEGLGQHGPVTKSFLPQGRQFAGGGPQCLGGQVRLAGGLGHQETPQLHHQLLARSP